MESQPDSADQEKRKAVASHFRKSTGMPAKFSVEEFIKALKVLNDKGGSAGIKELVGLYGKKKSEILSRALTFHDKLGFVNKKGHSCFITDEGRSFISLTDDSKKKVLAEKLTSYEPYKNILIALSNTSDKSLKKERITEIWSTFAGGGVKIRGYMTRTFASLGSWAGIIDDTGKSCKLLGPTRLPGSLEEVPETDTKPLIPGPMVTAPVLITEAKGVGSCPFCKGSEIGIIDEEVLRFIDRPEDTIVYLKRKFVCRTCQRDFSRTSQSIISNTKTLESEQKKTKKSNPNSK